MFTPPTLVMHESPAVLWAREGIRGSANIRFDLCNAKHFSPWLRFLLWSRVYLHGFFVAMSWDFIGMVTCEAKTAATAMLLGHAWASCSP